MQEQQPQNNRNFTTNVLKGTIIILAILGLLDKFNIFSLNKSRYNHVFSLVFGTAGAGILLNLLNERDIPEVIPPHAGLLAKFNIFSQQVTAIRSPKTVAEGAAKGLLCGGLLALVLLKDKGPDFTLVVACAFLGAAAGMKNQVETYFRPRPRDI